ncbi:MAG: hypothetical protein U0P30_08745 [Vicinamibacterales bacterium]
MSAEIPGPAPLLARLDDDPEIALARFEDLRRTIERFFDWRGASAPAECADDVLDRMSRRLAGGEVIESPRAFAYAVARLVWLEQQRPARRLVPLDAVPEPAAAATASEESPRLICLDRCLETLTPDTRALILRYYAHERREKVADHSAIADELGITRQALHNRAQRLRDKLARCLTTCLDAARQDRDGTRTDGNGHDHP